MRRVVITGLGAITPIGNDIPSYLNSLMSGKSGANLITSFDATNFKTKFACEIKDLNPEEKVDRKSLRKMDKFSLYGLLAADQAIENAGFDFDQVDLDRVGVIWGAGIGGLRSLEKEIEEFTLGNGTPRYNPFLIPKMIIDTVPGQISIKYGFRGVNYGTVSACASSSDAISNAFDYVRYGKNDVVITGGSEAAVTKVGIGGFNAMKALSTRNDDYLSASRPYDKDRDGFVLAEGSASLVLEELEHAKKRGATIYAELAGSAANSDAYHITAPHPEGSRVTKVMQMALKDAQVNLQDVDYINTHGTSTSLGDIAEIKAIQRVFQDDVYKINISSTKSMTGHLLGGAGAVEAIASILAINHNFAPPTINHFTDDPEIDSKLNLTFNTAQERKIKIALSNTFGFGGHNSSLVFKAFEG